jgi:hypothetical protein
MSSKMTDEDFPFRNHFYTLINVNSSEQTLRKPFTDPAAHSPLANTCAFALFRILPPGGCYMPQKFDSSLRSSLRMTEDVERAVLAPLRMTLGGYTAFHYIRRSKCKKSFTFLKNNFKIFKSHAKSAKYLRSYLQLQRNHVIIKGNDSSER